MEIQKNISELFKDYDKANAEWQAAKKLVEETYAKRSETIKLIFLANDSKKHLKRRTPTGSVQQLTIVRRGETFFFRGEDSESEVIELDMFPYLS